MRFLHAATLVFAAYLISAVTTSAIAATKVKTSECRRIAAIGDGLTESIAIIMSTNGLKNIIEAKGMKSQGPVKTTCKTGTFLPQCQSSQNACK